MRRLAAALLLAASLAGCGGGLAQLAEGLNERQITSCVRWQGSMRAGSGVLAGGHVAVSGVTATGGAALAACRVETRPGMMDF